MTRFRKNKSKLVHVINKYFNPNSGQTSVLILDTGTLIDLEDSARSIRNGQPPHKIAENQLREIGELADYVLFPKGIWSEIENHYNRSYRSGRRSIGNEVYNLVKEYREDSENILRQNQVFYFSGGHFITELDKFEGIINDLNSETNGCRKGGKKTSGKDPLSENDIELIYTAIKLGVQSLMTFKSNRENERLSNPLEGTYRIAIVSPDSHIYKNVNALINTLEGIGLRDYLQAFNPREYS